MTRKTHGPEGAQPRGRGAPTKLTPELHAKIVQAVLDGNAAETAAEAGGVCERSFFDWMARGRAGDGEIYVAFADAVMRARAEAEMFAVSALRVGMLRDPKYAVEWLKRARHRRWGPADQVEVRVGSLEHLTDEELEKKRLDLAKTLVRADPVTFARLLAESKQEAVDDE